MLIDQAIVEKSAQSYYYVCEKFYGGNGMDTNKSVRLIDSQSLILELIPSLYDWAIDKGDYRIKEIPHNACSTLTGEFQLPAACKFLDFPPVNLRNLQLYLSKNSLAT